MRVGVVDAGSNTVSLLVADVAAGGLVPVGRVRSRLRLAERLGVDRRLDAHCVDALAAAVAACRDEAERQGVDDLLAYATAVVRDAPNRDEVLETVAARTGIRLQTLPGTVEARLTFLAARRWMGQRAGTMVLLDIGGGSLEIACGAGEVPQYAVSLPLGAGRLTREHLPYDRPPAAAVRALRRHVAEQIDEAARHVRTVGPATAVATSRTFEQLARLCGAAPKKHSPTVPRLLRRSDLGEALVRLTGLPAEQRSRLPGISRARAWQAPAGAVVAHTVMKRLGIKQVQVCPWALREGAALHHVHHLHGARPLADGPGRAVVSKQFPPAPPPARPALDRTAPRTAKEHRGQHSAA